MTRSLAVVPLICLISLFSPVGALANDEPIDFTGHAEANYADLNGRLTQPGSRSPTAIDSTPARYVRTYVPACLGNLPTARRNLGALCDQARQVCEGSASGSIGYWVYTAPAGTTDWSATGQLVCRGGAVPDFAPEPEFTAADFRRLPIPAAELKVQPGDRRTLVNVPTNLYARSDPRILRTSILGFPIRVRATPTLFHWQYGDGRVRSTADAGGPYPRLDTAHTYLRTGRRTVTLATEYNGEYSVDGGPWQPIDGTATVTSPSVDLTVEEARAHLVS
jgi:hypothetical protein